MADDRDEIFRELIVNQRRRRRTAIVLSRRRASGGDGAGGEPEPDPLPLDDLTVTAAWSIARRLTNDYTGPLIRLRETGGSTELDIGYDGDGNLDAAAAAAHIGANAGRLVTIYDQVGANNLVQASAAAQGAYVASGIGTRPGMHLDGSSHLMTAHAMANTFSGSDTPCTVIMTAEADTAAADQTLFAFRHSTDADAYLMGRIVATATNWRFMRGANDAGSAIRSAAGADADPHVLTWQFAGTTCVMREDTAALIEAAMDVNTATFDRFAIGASVQATTIQYFDGQISEVVVAPGDLAAYRTDALSYYGIA